MIIGIGTDLVYIPRVAQTYDKQGDCFLQRCFADPEIEYILQAKDTHAQACRIAKRWAAKEALAKALGTGISGTIHLKDIYVVHDTNGAPGLVVQNGAEQQLQDYAKNKGATQTNQPKIHLSLTDDENYAQAFVVLSLENG